MTQNVDAEAAAPTTDREDDFKARISLKMSEEMHFKVRAACFALRTTMQKGVMQAVEEWLARNREAIRGAIRKAEETGIISISGGEEEERIEASNKKPNTSAVTDPSVRRS